MRMMNPVVELPPHFYREIGKVMVLHSFLEYALGRIAYDLLGVNQKQGRVAVRDPRSSEYIAMIEELASLAGIQISYDTSTLTKLLLKTKTQRDMLAHGIWVTGLLPVPRTPS